KGRLGHDPHPAAGVRQSRRINGRDVGNPWTRVGGVGHIDDISDRYLDQVAALDPIRATHDGLTGHDDRMTDFSPEGFAALAELDELTLAQLAAVEPSDEGERVAKEALQERLTIGME